MSEQALKRIDVSECGGEGEPCEHYLRATDGVHVVLVDRCYHPNRNKWAAEQGGDATAAHDKGGNCE